MGFSQFPGQTRQRYRDLRFAHEAEAKDLIEENGRVVGLRATRRTARLRFRADWSSGVTGRHSTVREKAG